MSEWVSVQNRLPDDYQEVLYLAINEMGSKEIMTGHRDKGNWTHCCMFYSTKLLSSNISVTHWMEIPGVPT